MDLTQLRLMGNTCLSYTLPFVGGGGGGARGRGRGRGRLRERRRGRGGSHDDNGFGGTSV